MLEREKIIKKTTFIGIFTNVSLGIIKLIIAFFTSSIAILSDAINNFSDVFSSFITLVGYKISKKKISKNKPLGYGRSEYLSALLVELTVIGAAIQCFFLSIKNINSNDIILVSPIMFCLLITSLIVKFILYKITIINGKKIKSDALIASAKDALSDSFSSMVTIIAVIFAPYTSLPLDSIGGIIISILIFKTGIESLINTINSLLGDKPKEDEYIKIKEIIENYKPLKGCYDLILHNYGPENRLATCNVEVPTYIHADVIFDAMVEAKEELYKQLGINFTFGIFAVNDHIEKVAVMKENILTTLRNFDARIYSLHAFHIHFDRNIVHFDLVLDYALQKDINIINAIYKKLTTDFPNYTFYFDVDYSYK